MHSQSASSDLTVGAALAGNPLAAIRRAKRVAQQQPQPAAAPAVPAPAAEEGASALSILKSVAADE